MSATINSDEYFNVLKLLQSVHNKKTNLRIPAALHGIHGIGKSEITVDLGQRLGYKVVVLNLSTQDVGDLLGIPFVGTDSKGKKSTQFAAPDWLNKHKEPVIYFLDEMNRAEPMVLQTMLPFVLEGRIHSHEIRPQDMVIAAMNPDTAEYTTECFTDEALISRFAHFYFEPEHAEFVQYCNIQGVHPAVIKSVTENAGALPSISVAEDSRINSAPDRRSFFKLGVLLNDIEDELFSKIGYKFISGMIGGDLAPIVVKNYQDTKEQYTLKQVIKGNTHLTRGDVDKFVAINDEIIAGIINKDPKLIDKKYKFTLKPKALKNFKSYFESMPIDTACGFLKSMKAILSKDSDTDEAIKILKKISGQIDKNFLTKVITSK